MKNGWDSLVPDVEEASRDAAARFPGAASEAGLLDVAYASCDSPFGTLTFALTPRGVVRLEFPDRTTAEVVEELARQVSPRVLRSPARTDPLRRELDEYFEGSRRRFDVPVDLSRMRGFFARVLAETSRIPYGEVHTYRQVAEGAGSPRAVRAAGNALGANPIPIVVPCHRVVRTGGGLGGYTSGLDRKVKLLQLEGALP